MKGIQDGILKVSGLNFLLLLDSQFKVYVFASPFIQLQYQAVRKVELMSFLLHILRYSLLETYQRITIVGSF